MRRNCVLYADLAAVIKRNVARAPYLWDAIIHRCRQLHVCVAVCYVE